MLAIHNLKSKHLLESQVANAFAKLSKCQQFTTYIIRGCKCQMLQTLLQSYQNVSNSQLCSIKASFKWCCKRFCKVIKMLAIHNQLGDILTNILVANAFAKLSKCQQFTTSASQPFARRLLQTLLQSYQNVSNSQPNSDN